MKTLPVGAITLVTTRIALAQNENMMNGGTGHGGWMDGNGWMDGWMGGYGGVCLSIILFFIIISFIILGLTQKQLKTNGTLRLISIKS
jgi:uncharacterized membrane protein